MRFAKWVFLLAGIAGVLFITPVFFLEKRLGEEYPPAINHPEFFYGFLGAALVWQFVYLTIGLDPMRFRPLMLIAALAKASVFVPFFILFAMQRIPATALAAPIFDFVCSLFFTAAFLRTSKIKNL